MILKFKHNDVYYTVEKRKKKRIYYLEGGIEKIGDVRDVDWKETKNLNRCAGFLNKNSTRTNVSFQKKTHSKKYCHQLMKAKRHDRVLRDIMEEIASIESEGLGGQLIFGESTYKNSKNKKLNKR